MIQVFDFIKIDEIRKNNKFNLQEKKSYQGETYGFVFYEIDHITKEYIQHFEENVKTVHAQYVFEKDLNNGPIMKKR